VSERLGSHIRTLPSKILALHEMLDSARVPHQFGGAIALAWYRSPRATTNIDVNVTVPPTLDIPVLATLAALAVSGSPSQEQALVQDGQARFDWQGTYLDVFMATVDFHHEMARLARRVEFGPATFSILAPEHLMVCKTLYDRDKDWLDLEEMVRWGTAIDVPDTLRWVRHFLGDDADQVTRLAALLRSARA